ncbi:MAG TPA: alanine--tRNA ligase [Verrucomicrobia bacterium]|nr:alanine--tRNA ligase [Verrucomicrobiota bacterium]HOB31922.1 alanine--tRNA ligase [Verrucomicrobiota bacterium]HOP97349.1 alanine--tRNA ligase [Verrucomicrobiota bacterium]
MTSQQIRQSYLDFFKSKGHTIVPSASLMPDAPNLLFTNAGMNQFVPIFLGQRKPDVSKWAGAIAGLDTRAADTQKCIRAGGKHNDLEDVGLDTYHHTFFEMLGNWSFGDYFKKEAIDWAWELVVNVWKFPKERLYATVYKPDPALGDPSEIDQEAYDIWAEKFRAAGLDPAVHIVFGNKKDNFWMMGDTGPCGPCSEIHVDLTPSGDTKGALVNKGDARCIEIWNLVFIQFNANPDGTFSPLPARHVDTGMGLERVTAIIQGTKGFKDFANAKISNYETDIFRPLFDAIEKLSGKKYCSTLPMTAPANVPVAPIKTSGEAPGNIIDVEAEKAGPRPGPASDDKTASPPARGSAGPDQVQVDVAFRVIADHIRTLSFAIADGILPSNEGRGYVLRRVLRRAVRYGRNLGFREPFFCKLVGVLSDTMGDVFPEIRAKRTHVEEVIRREEEAFNRTLDRGIAMFNEEAEGAKHISGALAFKLYDEQGFPLDLTELMARERGLTVDVEGFNRLMEEQKALARRSQKKEIIELSQIDTSAQTRFVGYQTLETAAKVVEVLSLKGKTAVILDASACYAEMGGQVGDTGQLSSGGRLWRIVNTQKSGNAWLHLIADDSGASPADTPRVGDTVTVIVDKSRRESIQRHHTVTHLLHWALHEVVSKDASQKGSYVGPDKLTFDFNSAPLTPQQVADVEKLVNERIIENAGVSWTEVPYSEVRARKDIMQFFGEKYGDVVRVVQIGGQPAALDGYSMELCGGTHTRATGEIGLFRIVGEGAIAAGVRRIEAVAGPLAYDLMKHDRELIRSVAGRVNSPIHELERKIEALLEHQKALEREVRIAMQRNASNAASELLNRVHNANGIPLITHNLGDANGDFLQAIVDALKGRFKGVVVLGGASGGAVALVASVSPEFTSKVQAGKLIQQIAPIVGGKGGGKPDNARGGGRDASKLDEALAKVGALMGG